MKPLDPKFFEGLENRAKREGLQAACDAVQPDRRLQGPIFSVGEILEIRGGKFQVTKIEPGYLKLKSLPR